MALHGTHMSSQSATGELLADVSRALVHLYKECYGKGPTKARTYMSGDLLVCLLEGGFARAERTLRDAGRGDAVSGQREVLQDVLRKRFIDTISEVTGRKVVTFISGVDLETETNAEVFVLEPAEDDVPSGVGHATVRAWAEQYAPQDRE